MPKKLMNTMELADFLGLSPNYVRLSAQRGDFPAIKIGSIWRFDPEEVIAKFKTDNNIIPMRAAGRG